MTHIITGPDGTRYRAAAKQEPTKASRVTYLSDGMLVLNDPDGFWINFGKDPAGRVLLEELPRIPDWPLPGPAPQYLASTWDDPDVRYKAGDWFLYYFMDNTPSGHKVEIMQVGGAETSGLPGIRMRHHSVRGFIVARANPTEDA